MTNPTEMELRVAKAIDDLIDGWFTDRIQANLDTLSMARAAIRAMREPTEKMIDASMPYMDSASSNGAWWKSMIDTASPERKT